MLCVKWCWVVLSLAWCQLAGSDMLPGSLASVGRVSRQLSALSDAHDRCLPRVSSSPGTTCQVLRAPRGQKPTPAHHHDLPQRWPPALSVAWPASTDPIVSGVCWFWPGHWVRSEEQLYCTCSTCAATVIVFTAHTPPRKASSTLLNSGPNKPRTSSGKPAGRMNNNSERVEAKFMFNEVES